MNANTALITVGEERLGVMVRSHTSAYVYWRTRSTQSLALRVTDLSGRPAHQSLDGTGMRTVALGSAQTGHYLEGLVPGHIYSVVLGEVKGESFTPLLEAQPVQTPWLPVDDPSAFPPAYHRS